MFVIDHVFAFVAFAKTIDQTMIMLHNPARQTVCNAGVQYCFGKISYNVNKVVVSFHRFSISKIQLIFKNSNNLNMTRGIDFFPRHYASLVPAVEMTKLCNER